MSKSLSYYCWGSIASQWFQVYTGVPQLLSVSCVDLALNCPSIHPSPPLHFHSLTLSLPVLYIHQSLLFLSTHSLSSYLHSPYPSCLALLHISPLFPSLNTPSFILPPSPHTSLRKSSWDRQASLCCLNKWLCVLGYSDGSVCVGFCCVFLCVC